jgi:hypothetical protein
MLGIAFAPLSLDADDEPYQERGEQAEDELRIHEDVTQATLVPNTEPALLLLTASTAPAAQQGEATMSDVMSVEQEILVLKDLTEAVARRLDALSARVEAPQRASVRLARAEALSLCDALEELTRAPSSRRQTAKVA